MRRTPSIKNSTKDLALHYFSKTEEKDHWKCLCGCIRKQAVGNGKKAKYTSYAPGYTNLVSHIKSAHPDYAEEMQASSGSIVKFTLEKPRMFTVL